MKKYKSLLVISFLFLSITSFSQSNEEIANDSTGLPGDHFSLQGALEMFKKSATLEEFEKNLNSESNYVNNLDLNDDGKTDYITVNDLMEGNTHAIVLKVAINKDESQDVAVIETQKDNDQSATLQIIGDEELYGEKKIVEPYEEKETPAEKSGGYGPFNYEVVLHPVIVNVWGWPCVRFIFAPAYIPWVSPWHWDYYPVWWSPWYVHPWRWHYMHCYHWGGFYHPCGVRRIAGAGAIYAPRRSVSVVVRNRYAPVHAAYREHRENGNRNQRGNENRGREEKAGNRNAEQHKENGVRNNDNKNNQRGNKQSRQERKAGRQEQRGGGKERGTRGGGNGGGHNGGGGRRGGGGGGGKR